MTVEDVDAARAIALRELTLLEAAVNCPMALLDRVEQVSLGWIFFYNSRAYLETRNPMMRLAGNGPLLIDRDGTVHALPTAVSWQQAIRDMESPGSG